MKNFRTISIFIVMLACFSFPSKASGMSSEVPLLDGKVIFGGTYTLESGQIINESLIVIGGVVVLEEGSIVIGDVVVIAGNVTIDGEVSQNVVVLGGVLSLGETAIIYGDMIAPGSAFKRADGAKIQGQIITDEDYDYDVPEIPAGPELPEVPEIPDVPEVPEVITPITVWDRISYLLTPITDIFWLFFQTFALAAVAVLVIMFFPKQVERTNKAVVDYPFMAGGMGCLTVIASGILMVGLSITIILIPATLLLGFVLAAALFLGWIPIGQEVGRRVSEAVNQKWAIPVQAAVGSALLYLLVSGFSYINLGFFSAVLSIVISSLGLGSVIMTRFGTREYAQTADISVPQATLEALGVNKKRDKEYSESLGDKTEDSSEPK